MQASEEQTAREEGEWFKKRATCDTDEPATKSLTSSVNVYARVCVLMCMKSEDGGGGKSVAD